MLDEQAIDANPSKPLFTSDTGTLPLETRLALRNRVRAPYPPRFEKG